MSRVRDSSGKPGAVFGEDLERMARRRVFEPERPTLNQMLEHIIVFHLFIV
jgi:hypothetical protein